MTNHFKAAAGFTLIELLVLFSTTWRRGSESNAVFTDFQHQYPDLRAFSTIDFKGVQALFVTTRPLPALTSRVHPAYSVIEEIVEAFVEGIIGRATTRHRIGCRTVYQWH